MNNGISEIQGFITKVLFCIALVSISHSLLAQKTDTVYFMNGDRVTGEIKGYEFGYLKYKTDGMSTISIEFDEIRTIHSKYYYDIRTSNGFRYFGSFDTSYMSGFVNIVLSNDRILKPLIDIVEITPIKRAFWKRIDGFVELGYSFVKASTISELNFGGEVKYRYEKNFVNLNVSTNFTDQSEKDPTSRQDYTLRINRLVTGKSFVGIYGGAQQNSELGLNLRLLGGGGIGHNVLYTNLHRLFGMVGLLVTQEYSSNEKSTNVEGLFQVDYNIFKFNVPKVNISTHVNFYPSLTTKDRYRLEYDLTSKFEIISDFYISLSFNYSYDSKPVDETANTTDYTFRTSIGYNF